MRRSKEFPTFDKEGWRALFESGRLPDVYVDVWNCTARILLREGDKYRDVTDLIPNGKALAERAVRAFGGALNISGWYPPTNTIIQELVLAKLLPLKEENEL